MTIDAVDARARAKGGAHERYSGAPRRGLASRIVSKVGVVWSRSC